MVRRAGNSANSSKNVVAEQEGSDTGEDITRCICGNDEFVSTPRTKALNASPGLYVQCERCNVWQHGFCMGFHAEKDVPNDYYCELCEPGFHRISQRHGILMSKYRPHKPPSDHSTESAPKSQSPPPPPSIDQESKDMSNATEDSKQSEHNEGSDSDSQQKESSPSEDSKPSPTQSHHNSAADENDRGSETVTDIKEEERVPPNTENTDDTYPEYPPEEPNNDLPKDSVTTPTDDGKKRATRRNPPTSFPPTEADNTPNAPRNRKRRSREDEILQRVLEESAREAREAEARRRSLQGLPMETDEKESYDDDNESRNGHQEDNEISDSPRLTRPKRSRGPSSTPSEAKRRDVLRNGSAGRPSRGGRPGRGGRRGGSRTAANYGAEPLSPTSTSSRRTANGVKKCKPRIPSQKTTFDEMRKRVASILEYSSRTQDELSEEQRNGISTLKQSANTYKFDTPLKHLSKMCDKNFANLEELTRKLLQWEEQFGIKELP